MDDTFTSCGKQVLRGSENFAQAASVEAAVQIVEAMEFRRIIDRLRSQEADSVEILCDNPDFIGSNNAIECNGYWTDYQDRRFVGDTLMEALQAAETDYLRFNKVPF